MQGLLLIEIYAKMLLSILSGKENFGTTVIETK